MKKWIVVLAYDEATMHSIHSTFPEIDEDFLYCGCFEAEPGEDYYTFEYESLEIQIEPRYIREIKKPAFDYQDKVRPMNGKCFEETTIYRIHWNFEYQEFRYFLRTGENKHLSYYTGKDLRLQDYTEAQKPDIE